MRTRSSASFGVGLGLIPAIVAALTVRHIYQEGNLLSSGLALLPIVAHAFAVLAGAGGRSVVRAGPRESLPLALFRGQASSSIVASAGLAGAALWLVGDHWRPLTGGRGYNTIHPLMCFERLVKEPWEVEPLGRIEQVGIKRILVTMGRDRKPIAATDAYVYGFSLPIEEFNREYKEVPCQSSKP